MPGETESPSDRWSSVGVLWRVGLVGTAIVGLSIGSAWAAGVGTDCAPHAAAARNTHKIRVGFMGEFLRSKGIEPHHVRRAPYTECVCLVACVPVETGMMLRGAGATNCRSRVALGL